jgi:hypothetical protein
MKEAGKCPSMDADIILTNEINSFTDYDCDEIDAVK